MVNTLEEKFIEFSLGITRAELYKRKDSHKIERKVEDFFDVALKQGFGSVWDHNTSGIWYLRRLLKDKPELKSEVKKVINLDDPINTWINIAKLKPAENVKVAEVAGNAYAWLTAFLGGEGTYCVDSYEGASVRGAEIISPFDISQIKIGKDFFYSKRLCTELGPETLGPNKYQRIDFPNHKTLTEKQVSCGPENCLDFFKPGDYNLFMAVNHGNSGDDTYLYKIAERLLKNC